MPETAGRPPNQDDTVQVKFRISEHVYTDIAKYARQLGLSVPMYVAMMMSTHIINVRHDALLHGVDHVG